MAYNKTIWTNLGGETINADNLNKLEQGVFDTDAAIVDKVDKVTGKGLSENDYLDAEKAKVANLPSDTTTELGNKVDKVTGKGLSENDYLDAEKAKVANLPSDTTTELGNKASTIVPNQFQKAQGVIPKQLTYGTSVIPNSEDSNIFKMTLNGDATIERLINATVGRSGTFYIRQDSTGGRTLSWDETAYKLLGTHSPNTSPHAVNLYAYEIYQQDIIVVTYVDSFISTQSEEMLVNSLFDNNVDNWSADTGASFTWESGGNARFINTSQGGEGVWGDMAVELEVGETYTITAKIIESLGATGVYPNFAPSTNWYAVGTHTIGFATEDVGSGTGGLYHLKLIPYTTADDVNLLFEYVSVKKDL